MKNSFFRLIFKSIGLVIMYLLLRKINFDMLINYLSKVDIDYLLVSLFLTVPLFMLKIKRWRMILSDLGIELNTKRSITIYGAGLFLGQITPGQIGEIIRGYLLSRKGFSLKKALNSVLIDRLLDLFILVFISFFGFIYFIKISLIYKIALTIIPLFVFLFIFKSKKFLALFEFDFKLSKLIKDNFDIIRTVFRSRRLIIQLSSLSLLSFLVTTLRAHYLLKSISINMPFLDLNFCMAIANTVSLLPISVAGIGTRDYTMIYIFNGYGLSSESAITFSFLIFLVAYVLNVIWGFVAWIIEPVNS